MSGKIKYTMNDWGNPGNSRFSPFTQGAGVSGGAVKITITLNKKSVDFLSRKPVKHHTQYQRMIRKLIDAYVEAQERA